MAVKKVFRSAPVGDSRYFIEEEVEYEFHPGFAVSQKQKNITSLHESIRAEHPDARILEVSTKSANGLGVKLSAFSLMFYHEELGAEFHLENVFQSSKVFAKGGPYRDLLKLHPRDAKRDERLKESGELVGFDLYGELWPCKPGSWFYDWIYINALARDPYLSERIMEFDCFTDVEFNHKRSLNCQARAAAIFVSLVKRGELEAKLCSREAFVSIYGEKPVEETLQLSWF